MQSKCFTWMKLGASQTIFGLTWLTKRCRLLPVSRISLQPLFVLAEINVCLFVWTVKDAFLNQFVFYLYFSGQTKRKYLMIQWEIKVSIIKLCPCSAVIPSWLFQNCENVVLFISFAKILYDQIKDFLFWCSAHRRRFYFWNNTQGPCKPLIARSSIFPCRVKK